jgi:hypothetical protein
MLDKRLGVLLLLWGCGGAGASPGAVGAGAGDASADVGVQSDAVYRALSPRQAPVDGGPVFTLQCVPAPLPVDKNGTPNCIFVSAIQPIDDSSQGIAACNRCDAPGLEPFVAPAPLESIGEGLSNYSCLCAVKPRPGPDCSPPDDDSTPSWCYSSAPSSSAIPGFCPPGYGPFLAFSPPALEAGPLYVACFAVPGQP